MMKHIALFMVLAVAPGCVVDTATVASTESQLAFDEPVADAPAGRSFSCLTKEGSTCKAACEPTMTFNGKQCTLDQLHTEGANSPAGQCYYEPTASIACYYACDDQIGLERVLVGCTVEALADFDAVALPLDDVP